MDDAHSLISNLKEKFRESAIIAQQNTADGIVTLWINPDKISQVLIYLKNEIDRPFRMLYDITAIDERRRTKREDQPASDFTVVYHLTSFERNQDIRIKTALQGEYPSTSSITNIWTSANWYEREVYDMFGITFTGHPHMRRILMPQSWKGFPLRKEYPARATEMEPFVLEEQMRELDDHNLTFNPEDWDLKRQSEDTDFMFLNIGPQHPGTHGLLRLVLQLDGEDIVDIVPDIGFHHRGAEKMGERQTWHKYIPYTDRIDYLGGVMNNLAYLLSIEKLAGIEVPDRAKVIRVMMSELFRIGGVAHDLPNGWEKMIQDFVNYFPKRLKEYDQVVIKNSIFKARTVGIGVYTTEEAIEWGITGAGLRATGFNWDYRKKRPYSGIDQFDFEIPIGKNGDCYDRALVRMEEMRQSLRIIQQCVKNMPAGDYKSGHPLAVPPRKEKTMKDIETLITHFLAVTWGPVIPAGEAIVPIEAAKGSNGYYLISDGGTSAYRSRIRTPSFPHMQMVPLISKGYTVADLLSILGAMDFVLADLDR